MNPPVSADDILERIRKGDPQAIGDLFQVHRSKLWRVVSLRLDHRIYRRVSVDDVLQEAFLDVSRRISEFLSNPTLPVYIWMRSLTIQRMLMIQRTHMGVAARSVSKEVRPAMREGFVSSDSMAGQLVSHLTSPSQAILRVELQQKVREALDEMDPLDREVLALRHFEELPNNEVALVLGISKDAASKRHIRALMRLKAILTDKDTGSLIG